MPCHILACRALFWRAVPCHILACHGVSYSFRVMPTWPEYKCMVEEMMGSRWISGFHEKKMTCLQLVGTWVQSNFRNLVPDLLTCPRIVGTWVQNILRNLVLDFLACHVPNVACHGVSISIVSISSMSCHVRILRVSVSVTCRGHPLCRLGLL